ncbi:MAG: heparinase [Rhodospirillaceae bacterium]|nr:heparinase [Rhodospirillaceae bacterium]
MAHGLRAWTFRSRLYDLSLGRGDGAAPSWAPDDLWQGQVTNDIGVALDGNIEPRSYWSIPADGSRREYLERHRFSGFSNTTAELAQLRQMAAVWLANFDRWHTDVWRLDILGDRLNHWLIHDHALTDGADDDFVRLWRRVLRRQARHLVRWAHKPRPGDDPMPAVQGAIMAALAFPEYSNRLKTYLAVLTTEIERHINADGGHAGRSPARHLDFLARLITIRTALSGAYASVPQDIQGAIDRMTPMLRAYRHGDHGLALFNGSRHATPEYIDRVLELSGSRSRAAASAPHTGFYRLGAQRTALIVDAGTPVDGTSSAYGHAGTLSFEMSIGKQRLIVNCGTGSLREPMLCDALRATAAHSTLTIGNTHSSNLVANGRFGQRKPRNIQTRRRELERNILVESSHDGYLDVFGLIHWRSLYLSAEGSDVRGEDAIESGGTKPPSRELRNPPYTLRFHLHPDVDASLTTAGNTVLLRLASGQGWRFHTEGGNLSLEESVYCAEGGRQKTEQIIVSGIHQAPRTMIKWRISREARA